MMNITIGSDHGGYQLKKNLIPILQKKYKIIDVGVYNEDSIDYPDICKKLIHEIRLLKADIGIIICGTGIGVSICCNRFKGIRCALCHDEYTAKMSKKHNNANILALGGRILSLVQAINIIQIFIDTKFEGGRHRRRLDKIDKCY